MKRKQATEPPVSVHINADPNMSKETAEALGEMIRLAVKAIREGKLGKQVKG